MNLPASLAQRLIGAAGLEGGLNQAIMDALESTIDEYLSHSLESYSSLLPAACIAKACQDMQAAIVRMKRAYSNASEGTPEQARAQEQNMTSSLVNTLPITKKNKHTVVTEAPKKVHVLLSR